MKVAERLEMISEIGRELQSRYTFSEIYSYLGAFSIPRLENGLTNSKWVYVKEALAEQPTEIISKIAVDLELQSPEIPSSESAASLKALPALWAQTKYFKLFISHLAQNRDKAKRLKEALAYYQISGFVAHDDIAPTREWQDEIERGLHSMDAMVTIHTKGFADSFWCQQEVGFALGQNIKIIPLRMGEDPKGFISKIQAIARRDRKAEEIAGQINDILHSDSQTGPVLTEAQKSSELFPVETWDLPPEAAALIAYQHKLDFEEAGSKFEIDSFVYCGVHVTSRYGVKAELDAMKAVIKSLPADMLPIVTSIWCDSKAQSVYTVGVRGRLFSWEFARELNSTIVNVNGGHNGVYFESDGTETSPLFPDHLAPDWNESDLD